MRKTYVKACVLACLLLSGAAGVCQTTSNPATDDAALRPAVDALIASLHGKVALYAEQPSTGRVLAIDADKPVQTASTIKLAMLYHAVNEVAQGRARWDEKLVLKPGDGVSGSGILPFLDTPLTLTLKDVATLMVIVSDNTGTNMMIDRFTAKAVDARMQKIGLRNTWLYKKVMKPATEPMPADQKQFGLGKTTAHEMSMLALRLGRCELDEAAPREAQLAACKVAVQMMRNQFYRDDIPRYLETLDASETGSGIANKTGALDHVRADVALIGAKSGPIVLSIFTYDNEDTSWTADNAAELTIAKLARAIVTTWSPQGIDSAALGTLAAAAPSH